VRSARPRRAPWSPRWCTEEPLGLDEVMNILDEASQVRAYTRELEQKSLR
jgi:hypothetical protein